MRELKHFALRGTGWCWSFPTGSNEKKARAGNEKCNNNNIRSLRLFVWARLRRNQSDDINSNNNNDVPLGKQHAGKQAGKAMKAGGKRDKLSVKDRPKKMGKLCKVQGQGEKMTMMQQQQEKMKVKKKKQRQTQKNLLSLIYLASGRKGCEM